MAADKVVMVNQILLGSLLAAAVVLAGDTSSTLSSSPPATTPSATVSPAIGRWSTPRSTARSTPRLTVRQVAAAASAMSRWQSDAARFYSFDRRHDDATGPRDAWQTVARQADQSAEQYRRIADSMVVAPRRGVWSRCRPLGLPLGVLIAPMVSVLVGRRVAAVFRRA